MNEAPTRHCDANGERPDTNARWSSRGHSSPSLSESGNLSSTPDCLQTGPPLLYMLLYSRHRRDPPPLASYFCVRVAASCLRRDPGPSPPSPPSVRAVSPGYLNAALWPSSLLVVLHSRDTHLPSLKQDAEQVVRLVSQGPQAQGRPPSARSLRRRPGHRASLTTT